MSHPLFENNSNSTSFLNEYCSTIVSNYHLKIQVDLRSIARGSRNYKLDSALKSSNPIERRAALNMCEDIYHRLKRIARGLRQIENYKDNSEPIPMNRQDLRDIEREYYGITSDQCEYALEYYEDIVKSRR